MFGIGISEIILIFLVIVVIVRPDDLPKFLRSVAKLYGQIRRVYKEVVDTKDKIFKEIDEAITLDGGPAGSKTNAQAPREKPAPPAIAPPADAPVASPTPVAPPVAVVPTVTAAGQAEAKENHQ